jgi:ATP-dependent RNA helicase MSS116
MLRSVRSCRGLPRLQKKASHLCPGSSFYRRPAVVSQQYHVVARKTLVKERRQRCRYRVTGSLPVSTTSDPPGASNSADKIERKDDHAPGIVSVSTTSDTPRTSNSVDELEGENDDHDDKQSVVAVSFQELENLDAAYKEILAKQDFFEMTEIQAKTWEVAVAGQDVVGRARTGTGKSLAFLLPSLQRIVPRDNKIQILVLSPTRELAQQIADQAALLLTRREDDNERIGLSSQVMVGGVPKQRDLQRMEAQIPTVLTATPGRLLDHLEDNDSSSSKVAGRPFRECLDELQVLVLDEIDRLLDMGFREDIQRIVSLLPKERQTLLFSATIPRSVQNLVVSDGVVKPNHVLVDCIADASLYEDEGNDDPWTITTIAAGEEIAVDSTKIEQSHVILPPDRLIAGVVQIILKLMQDPQHKILVFFPTTSQVTYFANLFHLALGRRVLSLHSKRSQMARTVTSELYREAREAVLLTSDVSARGVDYPNVTTVVQVGAALNRDTYIHRLGRTGRAGKTGKGILVMMDSEKAFLERDLADFDIPVDEELSGLLQRPLEADLELNMMRAAKEMRSGENPELVENAQDLYRTLLGYYNTQFKGLQKEGSKRLLVDTVNAIASQAGLRELPFIPEKLAKQAGVMGHSGLNIRSPWSAGQSFDVGRRKGRVEGRAERFLPDSDKPVDNLETPLTDNRGNHGDT